VSDGSDIELQEDGGLQGIAEAAVDFQQRHPNQRFFEGSKEFQQELQRNSLLDCRSGCIVLCKIFAIVASIVIGIVLSVIFRDVGKQLWCFIILTSIVIANLIFDFTRKRIPNYLLSFIPSSVIILIHAPQDYTEKYSIGSLAFVCLCSVVLFIVQIRKYDQLNSTGKITPVVSAFLYNVNDCLMRAFIVECIWQIFHAWT
jgi:hypothetical protein